jgi:cell division protein YceG involved in septum cleavage
MKILESIPIPIKFFSNMFLFIGTLILLIGIVFILWTKGIIFNSYGAYAAEQFPVGVDSNLKTIVENPLVEQYVENHLSIDLKKLRQHRIADKLLAEVSKWNWYQQLASPTSRILVIYPGERREEIVENFGNILHWSKDEEKIFSDSIIQTIPAFDDGKFFPGRYTVGIGASPEEVSLMLQQRFTNEILLRYGAKISSKVPLKDILIIASLLEREAYDFTDMRYISGVIWNRLFINMPLQLDATLQYVRGSEISELLWWPKVVPADKYISSPFNTYKNEGLPPSPISNPSVEAIVAALNPRNTDCMFYFHDSRSGFHCSNTYEEHVASLKKIYGRGK